MNRGLPSLFHSSDRSKSIDEEYGKHLGGVANPVDHDGRRFQRLKEASKPFSDDPLLTRTTAERDSAAISQELPLEDIRVRKDVEVLVDGSKRPGSTF